MTYKIVEVAEVGEDKILGYAIAKEGIPKLDSINLYSDYNEVADTVAAKNETEQLLAYRPAPNDPEVLELLHDPAWEPVEYEDVEVIDEDASEFVYIRYPARDITDLHTAIAEGKANAQGYELGLDGKPVIDYKSSDIVTKIEKHPKRTQYRSRIDAAITHVARARMEMDHG